MSNNIDDIDEASEGNFFAESRMMRPRGMSLEN